MSNVTFHRGDTEFIRNLPIKDGQLVYNTVTGETFEDYGDRRIRTSNTNIDDQGISGVNTWSSQRIVDSLCLPFDRTGPIVTCSPVEGVGIGVTSEIAVRQERPGEQGTPERPNRILPWNAAKLTVTGKNLIDISNMILDVSPSVADGNLVSNPSAACSILLPSDKASTFAFELIGTTNVYLFGYDQEKRFVSMASSRSSGTIKVSDLEDAFRIRYVRVRIDKRNLVTKLYLGNGTTWEPYTGKTYTATFPEPVASGKINWNNKTVSTNYVLVSKIASEFHQVGPRQYECQVPGVYAGGVSFRIDQYCDIAKIGNADNAATTETLPVAAVFSESLNTTTLRISNYLYRYLQTSGRKVTICYRVYFYEEKSMNFTGTPAVLSGENNLYTDTGDTTVTGLEAPKVALPTVVAALANQIDANDAQTTYTAVMTDTLMEG